MVCKTPLKKLDKIWDFQSNVMSLNTYSNIKSIRFLEIQLNVMGLEAPSKLQHHF